MSNNELKQLIAQLGRWFSTKGSVVVAFSGGVDSGLVAYLAHQTLGVEGSLAVLADSPSLKRRDKEEAIRFAKRWGMALEVIRTEEIRDPDYYTNPVNRCFFCKGHLYASLEQIRKRKGFALLVNGQNRDDLKDFRPGLQAGKEWGVRSPLIELGLGKDKVRKIARYLGLSLWAKPASPCLSSRFPYGHPITPDKLSQVEKAEEFLRSLGITECRVRHWGEKAVVEVPLSFHKRIWENKSRLDQLFSRLGFPKGWELDPEGFVSGKLNRQVL